jgi:hypothetical protein
MPVSGSNTVHEQMHNRLTTDWIQAYYRHNREYGGWRPRF